MPATGAETAWLDAMRGGRAGIWQCYGLRLGARTEGIQFDRCVTPMVRDCDEHVGTGKTHQLIVQEKEADR